MNSRLSFPEAYMRRSIILFIAVALAVGGCAVVVGEVESYIASRLSVDTQRGKADRTGEYQDGFLVPANVNQFNFGQSRMYEVLDGDVYSQPLLIEQASPKKNILLVATNNNSLYAFDADSSTKLWARTAINPPMDNTGGAYNTSVPPLPPPNFFGPRKTGIMGTPAVSGTVVYFVTVDATSCTTTPYNQTCLKHWLHKVDINTATSCSGASCQDLVSPRQISGSKGAETFNSYLQLQRPGLLVQNSKVYVAFGADNDAGRFFGWVFAYDAGTLGPVWSYCTICGQQSGTVGAGIWQAGSGIAGDGTNVYISTGNALTTNPPTSLGNSIIKLAGNPPTASLFSDPNSATLNADDKDFGCSGPVIIPGVNGKQYALAGGKEGRLYIADTATMGPVGNSLQATCNTYLPASCADPNNLPSTLSLGWPDMPHIHGPPVFWTEKNKVFVWGEKDHLRRYSFNPTPSPTFGLTSDGVSSIPTPPGSKAMPGGMLSLSSKTVNGVTTGIVWAAVRIEEANPNDTNEAVGRGFVRAIDADTLTELWHSDRFVFPKFPTVTPFHGRIYVPTFDRRVLVFEASTTARRPAGIALAGQQTWTTVPVAVPSGDGTFKVANSPIIGFNMPGADFGGYAANHSATMLTGDFNADQRTDIALVGGTSWTSVLLAEGMGSAGNGTFEASNNQIGTFAFFADRAVTPTVTRVAGDFNGDGKTDLALIGGNGWTTIPVAFSKGDDANHHFSGFTFANVSAVASFNAKAAVAGVVPLVADFDRDGCDDIALVKADATTLYVAYATPCSPTMSSFSVFSHPSAAFASFAMVANAVALLGDFDGDGKVNDIALTGAANANPAWTTLPLAFAGTGRTAFIERNQPVGNDFPSFSASAQFHLVGDFDGNGASDIALVGGPPNASWNTIPIAYSRSLPSDRNGNFDASNQAVISPGWYNGGGWPGLQSSAGVVAVSGDFDNDGRWDVALTGPASWATIPVALSNATSTDRNATWTGTTESVPSFPAFAACTTAMPPTCPTVLRGKF